MGKIFFLSNGIRKGNKRLNADLVSSISGSGSKIGYIPCDGDKDRSYFDEQLNEYITLGAEELFFFDITEEYNEKLLEELMECKAIHLSGGDPIKFRSNLLNRKMNPFLREYYHNGGTLIGMSGGAVQFGRSAGLFCLFQKNLEEALNNRDKLDTLQLAPFEFLPHFNRWTSPFKQSVEEYTKLTGSTVYACKDGDGIIEENGNISFLGEIHQIEGGTTLRIK
jgi:dipeptidase E